ncbi:hypothetical protein PHYBLDRAFT_64812 [Phycomyces blakesleeanus NRRL 1555(-)]|uniref:Uncharacterized protein n=1 Tax=Phycomyces blakesleeanus (strain ATCC 8743b / DSM 1359 / FGSC 10004 / NBRC 33097 / NRRL 1555) TaxID=763407 RepID=A0A162PL40_PHYB8|nr:hypothetical protein PHYBLDRAFT_64812 [Phycomyces blakesleeanus NRRL 1555(-)]OAD73857.1 hypothetical protein PHYBLDRAFT_64812 [Phycomyces blakesleeanus NRRL 1555(-)]|eukprot:XP_018291897.1 hypothetical protein PHYBLDRAFT_64812 [Phycomyces blakesleeanus NRRL 1555(-)]
MSIFLLDFQRKNETGSLNIIIKNFVTLTLGSRNFIRISSFSTATVSFDNMKKPFKYFTNLDEDSPNFDQYLILMGDSKSEDEDSVGVKRLKEKACEIELDKSISVSTRHI